jgi:hypothetical protein
MGGIFQRPLCEMGAAYDFSFRPLIGDADPGSGGPCDDRPRAIELFSAAADPASPSAAYRAFSLCPEHEAQLRAHDGKLPVRGVASRFRPPPAGPAGPTRPTR